MKLTYFDSYANFADHTHDFLMQYEVEHNLILDLTQRMVNGQTWDGGAYAASVDAGGEVVAVMIRTGLRNPILSRVASMDAIAYLVDDLHVRYDTLPGVLGPSNDVAAFAQQWAAKSGQQLEIDINERIYVLEKVNLVEGVAGQMRFINADDRELLIDWIQRFSHEAMPNSPESSAAVAADMVEVFYSDNPTRRMALWEHDGQVVSCAAAVGINDRSCRVGYVYTPPVYRRKGYASAIVASLSQHMLDEGLKLCMLYTDLSNPTSNKIYRDIGYQPVGDVDMYRFV